MAEKPKRRSRDPEATREAILAAARTLLAKDGPEGVSLSEVAHLAGVNRGTAYQHFETREKLVEAATEHVSDRMFRAVFGETPHRYLQRRRIERAMELLRDTDRPVTEVCLDVGFASLGFAVVGLLAFRGSFDLRLAAIVGLEQRAGNAFAAGDEREQQPAAREDADLESALDAALRAARLLELLEISELADRYPGHLAGAIGDAGLPSPNSLVIIVGRTPAQLAATPLVPSDYLDVFNPLRRGATLRGRIEEVHPETADAATISITSTGQT